MIYRLLLLLVLAVLAAACGSDEEQPSNIASFVFLSSPGASPPIGENSVSSPPPTVTASPSATPVPVRLDVESSPVRQGKAVLARLTGDVRANNVNLTLAGRQYR